MLGPNPSLYISLSLFPGLPSTPPATLSAKHDRRDCGDKCSSRQTPQPYCSLSTPLCEKTEWSDRSTMGRIRVKAFVPKCVGGDREFLDLLPHLCGHPFCSEGTPIIQQILAALLLRPRLGASIETSPAWAGGFTVDGLLWLSCCCAFLWVCVGHSSGFFVKGGQFSEACLPGLSGGTAAQRFHSTPGFARSIGKD